MAGKILLDMYGGCGPDLTGSSMGLTLSGLRLMVDSGDFQGHTSSSAAKDLINLRNSFEPHTFLKTHGHVDHVIGTLFQWELGALPRPTNFITSEITAEQLKTVFADAFGLQIKRLRIAKAVNAKISGLRKEYKRCDDLIAILNIGGMHNTHEVLQHYDQNFADSVAHQDMGKSALKRLMYQFVRGRNAIPNNKSLADLRAMMGDINETLEDLGEYRTDYSWRMITQHTIAEVLKRTFGIPYNQPYVIDKHAGVTATLYQAGHILGSSQVLISSPHHNILFSGDVGRVAGTPFLSGPSFPKGCKVDTVVLESTYGERLHKQSYTDALDEILSLQKGAKGDCLVMTIAYQKGPENLINMLKEKSRNITYFGRTLDDFRQLFLKYGGEVFRELSSPRLQNGYVLPPHLGEQGSRELICAPSGMGYGRSNDVARQMAGNKDSRVIITNFLPEHCPGYKLLHEKKLRTELGEVVPFKGEVFHVAGTSGHGDQSDLVEVALRYVKMGAKTIVLNHGGEQRIPLQAAIKARLHKEGLPQPKVLIPQNGDQIDLATGKIGKNLLHK